VSTPHTPGETSATYLAHAALFDEGVHFLNDLLLKHPELRGTEARIRPGRLEIVTVGGGGVVRDWRRALPPVVVHDNGIWNHVGRCGVTDVLKTGHITVTVERPL
jgi:hypothetical protein